MEVKKASVVRRFQLEAITLSVLLPLAILSGWSWRYIALGIVGYIAMLGLINVFRIDRVLQDVRRQPLLGMIEVIAFILMMIWRFSFVSTSFVLLFLSFLFYPWNKRIIAACVLICLILCLALLVLQKDIAAESAATYAYYFLMIMALLRIKQMKLDKDVS